MKKYLVIKLVYGEELQSDVHDCMLEEYEKACDDISDYAASLDAELLVEDSVNVYGVGPSYAKVEHNFPLTHEEKARLVQYISCFFVDGEVKGENMKTFNVLSAVRFLQTDGELFEM